MSFRKGFVALVVSVLTLSIWGNTALAVTEQVIEFMDISWDEGAYVYFTEVRSNLGLKIANPDIDDFQVIGNNKVVLEGFGTVEENCGFRIDITPKKDFCVAGYPVSWISAQSVYSVNDGIVNTNPIGSRVVQAKYNLNDKRIEDTAGAVMDIINKLSDLYGSPDEYISNESTSTAGEYYDSYRWNGNGSFVEFSYCLEADGDARLLQILYGIDYADELIEQIRHPEITLKSIDDKAEIDPENKDGL